jgi:hypothetical protein
MDIFLEEHLPFHGPEKKENALAGRTTRKRSVSSWSISFGSAGMNLHTAICVYSLRVSYGEEQGLEAGLCPHNDLLPECSKIENTRFLVEGECFISSSTSRV